MHGTKGRCELCTRVGESLYSAPFFCGSYFLLLTRVLYLEPPSFRMPASKQKSVYLQHRFISRQSLKKKVTLLRHWDSITSPKVRRACGLYSCDPVSRDTNKREAKGIWCSSKWSPNTKWKTLHGKVCFCCFLKQSKISLFSARCVIWHIKEVTGSLTYFLMKLLSFLSW